MVTSDWVDGNTVDDRRLLFANKMEKDLFLKDGLSALKGLQFTNILSKEKVDGYHYGKIGKDFLQGCLPNFDLFFYLCGPGHFSLDLKDYLIELGADENKIISEY